MAPPRDTFLRDYLQGQFDALRRDIANVGDKLADVEKQVASGSLRTSALELWKANLSGKLAIVALLGSGAVTLVWQLAGKWLAKLGEG